MISKLHESTRKDPEAKKKKSKGAHNILWVNGEEEPISEVTFSFMFSNSIFLDINNYLFLKVGEMVGEYSVRSESDSAVSGSWGEDDEEFDPKRRVILLPANQLNGLLTKIKEFLQ